MQARAERGQPNGALAPTAIAAREGPSSSSLRKRGSCGMRLLASWPESRSDRSCATSSNVGSPRRPGRNGRGGPLVNTLTSGRIAGLREYDGREVEGSWKPIVSRTDHESLRAALEPSNIRRSAPRSYYLSGGCLSVVVAANG
jgi:hypothetical protein